MTYSVCIFAGSNTGDNEFFSTVAEDLGKSLANAGITTVYGGGESGIMGALAESVIKNNGEIIGIIPRFLESIQITNKYLSKLSN